jgi:hypothetical protein
MSNPVFVAVDTPDVAAARALVAAVAPRVIDDNMLGRCEKGPSDPDRVSNQAKTGLIASVQECLFAAQYAMSFILLASDIDTGPPGQQHLRLHCLGAHWVRQSTAASNLRRHTKSSYQDQDKRHK